MGMDRDPNILPKSAPMDIHIHTVDKLGHYNITLLENAHVHISTINRGHCVRNIPQ